MKFEKEIKNLDCGDFLVVETRREYAVSFKVYKCSTYNITDDRPEFFLKKGKSSCETTHLIEQAKIYVDAFIKWDGCMDIDFFPDDEGSEHFCGPDMANELGLVIKHLYSTTGFTFE